MRFDPKSAAQIDEDGLFPDGIYDCEVIHAEDKESKAGNEMIELSIRVYHGEQSRVVKDWLLEKVAYKLRHAAETFGCMKQYEAGNLTGDNLMGKSGKCKLKLEPIKDTFPAKNSVSDYVSGDAQPNASQPQQRAAAGGGGFVDDLNDTIPFGPCWE